MGIRVRFLPTIATVFATLIALLVPAEVAAITHHATPADNLADVFALAAAGDTLSLACGVYRQEGLGVPSGVVVRGSPADPLCVVMESSGQLPVFILDEVTSATRIEYLTFTAAEDVVAADDLKGAAMRMSGGSPVIFTCRFTGLAAVHGAALYGADGSAPVIVNCRFEGNRAVVAGGAIMCDGDSDATVITSLFHDNAAQGSGGAIHAARHSRLSVVSCTFATNSAIGGSSLSAWDNSGITVQSSIIVDGVRSPGWIGDVGSAPIVICSDVFGNDGGDWVGLLAPLASQDGNLAADPQFCGAPSLASPFALDTGSPCAAPGASCGAYLGAFPVGCGAGSAVDIPRGETRLLGNRPNPFNPTTVIHFELAQAGPAVIDIFDVGGRRLWQLANESLVIGTHTATWDGRDDRGRPVAAGVYFYRLRTADAQDMRSMVLVK